MVSDKSRWRLLTFDLGRLNLRDKGHVWSIVRAGIVIADVDMINELSV